MKADTAIWKEFFALSTVGELCEFVANLDRNNARMAALRRYSETWRAYNLADLSALFDPSAHISEDLSTALYMDCPCIFLGGNDWAAAAGLPPECHSDRLSHLAQRIGLIRAHNQDAEIVLAVIPEKDYTLNRMFGHTGKSDGVSRALASFRNRLREHNIGMVFDEYFDGLTAYQNPEDYRYPDSHLPTANYIQVAAKLFGLLNTPWGPVQTRLRIQKDDEYCDLTDRLTGLAQNPVQTAFPDMQPSKVQLVDGSESFEDPLGDTRQVLKILHPLRSMSSLWKLTKNDLFGLKYPKECKIYD